MAAARTVKVAVIVTRALAGALAVTVAAAVAMHKIFATMVEPVTNMLVYGNVTVKKVTLVNSVKVSNELKYHIHYQDT